MLKYELTDAPAEEVASFYEQAGDKWVLKVEGVVPATKVVELESKVAEFRNNNIVLKQQLEQVVKTPLKDVDPKSLNVEEILAKHVEEMKKNYDDKITQLAEEKTKLSAHLERVVLSDTVKSVAGEYGVVPSAVDDVLNRAREAFIVQDGVAVPRESKLDKDGKPYTVKSWMNSLAESAPHLFGTSRGSGSTKSVRGAPIVGERSAKEKISAGLAQLRR